MTNELAVPSPTSFLLLSVQASPSLHPPSVHYNHTSGYLLGTTSNLGGGGGGGGGGNGGGGRHWQICWQLSVTFSATGLEHDFWGSPRVTCEETSHCMSSRNGENWFSMNCVSRTRVPEWHLRPVARTELMFLTKATTRRSLPYMVPIFCFFYLTQYLQDLFPSVKFV